MSAALGLDPVALGRGFVDGRGDLDGVLLSVSEKLGVGADSLLSADASRPPDVPTTEGTAEGVGPPKTWPIRPAPKCRLCLRVMYAVWVGGERFFECGFHGSRGRRRG